VVGSPIRVERHFRGYFRIAGDPSIATNPSVHRAQRSGAEELVVAVIRKLSDCKLQSVAKVTRCLTLQIFLQCVAFGFQAKSGLFG